MIVIRLAYDGYKLALLCWAGQRMVGSSAIDFARFMGHVQERYGKKAYSSEQIGRMYKAARDKRVDPETIKNDFDWWILHVDELEAEKRSNETISGEAMAERMGLTID